MSRSISSLALLAVAGLTACGDSATAPAAPEGPGIEAAVIRTEHSFRMTRTACNGERVTLVGMSDVVINEQDGIWSAVVRSNGQGAGQFTAYRIAWVSNFRIVNAGVTRESESQVLLMRCTGGTPDTFIREMTAVTRAPDGSVIVEVDFSDEACHGR